MAQVSALAERWQGGPGLYLDLLLGVNPDGYDVWSDREAFAVGASAGRLARIRSSRSLHRGLPAAAPRKTSATGYRYLRDVLKHHFQYAGVRAHRPPDGPAPFLLGAAGIQGAT